MKDEVSGEYSLATSLAGLSFIPSPLFFPRVPLAVPYWNGHTYREIYRAIISSSVIVGDAFEKLRALIRQTLKVENVLLCGSGSLALELALRAFGVRSGDEVIIPTFCCSAVVPPILGVGVVPVLADVDDALNLTVETVEAAVTRKTRAIIVPHLFGNPVNIQPIIELAHAKNIHVVDDAAQALGATIDGQAAGSFGDAGILSFGNEKICSGIGGGALVYSDRVLRDNLPDELARPSSMRTLRGFLSVLVWHRWRRWTAALAKIRSKRADPDAAPKLYLKESLGNLNAAVAASLVETLEENLAARRERVRAYQSLLGGDERMQLIAHRTGSACLTQVVRVLLQGRGQDLAAHVVRRLGEAGYEIQGSYVPIHLLGNFSGCVWDRLPYAERVWADLIELPCEPTVDLDDVERIATIVKRIVAE